MQINMLVTTIPPRENVAEAFQTMENFMQNDLFSDGEGFDYVVRYLFHFVTI